MHRRALIHLMIVVVAVVVLAPAAALAGKKVVAGKQSLQLTVSLQPTKAGARVASLRLRSSDLNSTGNGQQPPYLSHAIIFTLPKGTTFHFSPAKACQESKIVGTSKGAALCPASTKIGSGTVIVNARPAVKPLVHGTVTEFLGVDDKNLAGYGKGSAVLFLYVKTSLGLNTTDFFHFTKQSGALKLIAVNPKPSKPMIVPGDYTLQNVDLTTRATSSAYFQNPPTCSGSWRFALTNTNYFGQPTVSATDDVKCKS